MMTSEMMATVNKRIEEILANEQAQSVISNMVKEGKTEEEIKDFIHHLAIGTLMFGTKRKK